MNPEPEDIALKELCLPRQGLSFVSLGSLELGGGMSYSEA